MIYTSYFAKMRKMPENLVTISICIVTPQWYKGKQYKKLAPRNNFFSAWKITHDNHLYVEQYNREVLAHLDPHETVRELMELSGGKDIALMCYEKPTDFCHRHLVAQWLQKAGYEVREWKEA